MKMGGAGRMRGSGRMRWVREDEGVREKMGVRERMGVRMRMGGQGEDGGPGRRWGSGEVGTCNMFSYYFIRKSQAEKQKMKFTNYSKSLKVISSQTLEAHVHVWYGCHGCRRSTRT